MMRADIERRVRIIRERLVTEELPAWERAGLERNLAGYLKELEGTTEHTCENMTARRQRNLPD